MTSRTFIEQITDPVTGEQLTLRADSESELDAMVAELFGIAAAEQPPGATSEPSSLARSVRPRKWNT